MGFWSLGLGLGLGLWLEGGFCKEMGMVEGWKRGVDILHCGRRMVGLIG